MEREKEKMIEEMFDDLNMAFIKKLTRVGVDKKEVSKELVKMGYRKIPDGAVVLTKEELETTDKIPENIKGFYKWFIEIEKEQTHKETAMEFATNFENYLSDINTDYCTDDTVPEALYTSADIDKVIDRTLKDFGVVVDE